MNIMLPDVRPVVVHASGSKNQSDSEPKALDDVALKPIAKVSIPDVIVARLTEFILQSGLRVGDKLPSEREIMVRLSVGRSTLREAIKVLRAMGIVEVSVGEGMFVGRGDTSVLTQPLSWSVLMSGTGAHDIMESRRIIEVQLAGLAAERASDEEIATIGEELERLKDSIERGLPGSIIDIDFHLSIARAAGNLLLAEVLKTLHGILQAIIAERASRRGMSRRLEEELAELMPIHEAIKRRDPEGARTAMDSHLRLTEKRFTADPAPETGESS
jgi:GntR family transcriptional regulator, transcriptional repressor for pyruvate dehydrogenase complex